MDKREELCFRLMGLMDLYFDTDLKGLKQKTLARARELVKEFNKVK